MARDLIPPPSPAGRPAPDPEPHEPSPAEEATAPHAESPAAKPGPSQFRTRFGFLTGALGGCAIAAAVLFVILLGRDGAKPTTPATDRDLATSWSPWHPSSTTPINGAQEIAEKIGETYQARSEPLTRVTGGAIMFGTLPASVAIPAAGDRFQVVGGIGVQYTLAGTGQEGRLEVSKPSAARRRLLRREALELSLYSLRYLPDVSMVVTLLPPAPRAEQVHPDRRKSKLPALQKQAMFFRPGDLRKQLEHPLSSTMAVKAPGLRTLKRAEAKRIDELTLPNLYTYDHVQQQDGRIYLVLDRPS